MPAAHDAHLDASVHADTAFGDGRWRRCHDRRPTGARSLIVCIAVRIFRRFPLEMECREGPASLSWTNAASSTSCSANTPIRWDRPSSVSSARTAASGGGALLSSAPSPSKKQFSKFGRWGCCRMPCRRSNGPRQSEPGAQMWNSRVRPARCDDRGCVSAGGTQVAGREALQKCAPHPRIAGCVRIHRCMTRILIPGEEEGQWIGPLRRPSGFHPPVRRTSPCSSVSSATRREPARPTQFNRARSMPRAARQRRRESPAQREGDSATFSPPKSLTNSVPNTCGRRPRNPARTSNSCALPIAHCRRSGASGASTQAGR